MSLANPAALWLLALAVPVVLVHILRPRRTPVAVPSVLLWRQVERPVSAASPWQKLRWSLLLVAQLLAVALGAIAVAGPTRTKAAALADHTVFMIDASGSMAATDGSPDRLSDAKARARELYDDLPDGGRASIVVAGTEARVVATATSDRAEFDRSLRPIEATAGAADFADAFALAESLDTGQGSIGYVFVSDGGLTEDQQRLLPPGTRYERIGHANTNRAISTFSVQPAGGNLHALATVRNTGGPAATQRIRFDVDGTTEATVEVTIPEGGEAVAEADLPAGEKVEAFLVGEDLLASDNHAVAVAPRADDIRVQLVGDPLFWEELLTSIPGVTVDVVDEPADTNGYDLAIYNLVTVPADPTIPFIAIAPPGGLPASITPAGVTERPAITLVVADDALLRGLDMSSVAIASAQRINAGSAEVLLGAENTPLLVRGTYSGKDFLYLTFDLRESNFGVHLSFPQLGERMVTELTGRTTAGMSLEVGDPLPVQTTTTEVVGPDAQTRTVTPERRTIRADRPGFWTLISADGDETPVAVNTPTSESTLTPAEQLTIPAPSTDRFELASPRRESLRHWVVLPLLALIALEVFLAWRRLGVPRRQWYLSLALRGAVAALLIATLFSPSVRRGTNRVGTLFVIDASASVGRTGQEDADGFVSDAIGARTGGDAAGVVVFGAEPRLDRVVGELEEFGESTVVVDPTATDIAAALRLGQAALPSDAKRRIVLLSDGRATTGDLTEELDELEAAGIPVDVVTVGAAATRDAAVTGLDVPRVVREGESVPVVVNVSATSATAATVSLRRNGVEVDSQDVTLQPGNNEVRFVDDVGGEAGAVVRYQATVTMGGDTIPENDTGFGAVPVEGPSRVLVVEGTDGEAASLVNALEAGGLGTEVIGPADLPTVQELATFAGIVLVNVDAESLSGTHIEDLTTAVRDLGLGLVTVGGVRSYGVGGYRDSPLSDLLPVDSEITDPKRRKSVAEVLSIDTSESMSNCHCAEGANGLPIDGDRSAGGVNKTDISRAAAARTIEALESSDEIGVLAFSGAAEWVIDLQQIPANDVIENGLRSLQPAGNTNLGASLDEAAEALLESDAELKHIILFTDGFTEPGMIEQTAEEAGELYEEHGITTSVLATGEGAAPPLEDIAEAGNGRFYAGRDLTAVPQIMAEEAVIASRDFITEGEFLPEVTSSDEVVAPLDESPPLLGYVATTAKSQATTLLRIGPDRDPLLARWQAGLGRVTSWMSDADRWVAPWESWDGYVDFWSRVVKDTLPAGDFAGAVDARVSGGRLDVSVETSGSFPAGSTATAKVVGPDGQTSDVTLSRTGPGEFEGSAEAAADGSYAVGVTVVDGTGETVLASGALASASYAPEFTPGAPDEALLGRIASSTNGRTGIASADVWDGEGLSGGSRLWRLTVPLLLLAAVLWPIAVVLSRLVLPKRALARTPGAVSAGLRRIWSGVRDRVPKMAAPDPDNRPQRPLRPEPPPPPTSTPPAASMPPPPPRPRPSAPAPAPAAPSSEQPAGAAPPEPPAPKRSALDDLLAAKRDRKHGDGG